MGIEDEGRYLDHRNEGQRHCDAKGKGRAQNGRVIGLRLPNSMEVMAVIPRSANMVNRVT